MRQIDNIVIHCSATSLDSKVSSIMKYWHQHLKWKNPGYHIIVPADGSVVRLLPDHLIANGVRGHNYNSLHICYIGGKYCDDRTDAQKEALKIEVQKWKYLYPNAQIKGHRDFPGVEKACPNFEVSEEF